MQIVDLPVQNRDLLGSAEARRIRRAGGIPCNLYGGDRDPVNLTTTREAFAEVLKAHTAVVRLTDENVKQTALIREVSWDTFGDHVEHLDLVRVEMKDEVKIRVPIHFVGVPMGQSHGGTVHEVHKDLEVFSRVESIPSELRCDISKLDVGDGIRAGEFEFPEGVRNAMNEDELVVMIHAPKLHVEEPVEGEEGAEPAAEGAAEEAAPAGEER
ncbi:MAG: 50S ribosomal protein L25 [Planctomycetota bacterium]|jgi:large subunit ribosomal protein L25